MKKIVLFFYLMFNFIFSQKYNKEVLTIERYLTDNSPIPEEYFINLLEDNDSEYVNLMYAYHLIKAGDNIKANSVFHNRSYTKELVLMNTVLGLFKLSDNQIDESKLYFDKAYQMNPSNKWVNLELYFYFLEMDAFNQAIKHLDDAIRIDDNFNEALIERSLYYDSLENCREIIEVLNKVPATYKDFKSSYWLGTAYYNCGDIEKAKNSLNESISIQESSDAFFSLAMLYSENTKKAKVYFLKSLELGEKNIHVLNAFSWFLYDTKEIKESEKYFNLLIEQSQDQETYNQLIQFYIYIKNYNKASEFITKSETDNGVNFMNEGYSILLDSILGVNNLDKSKLFKEKYNDFEINWLKSLLIEHH